MFILFLIIALIILAFIGLLSFYGSSYNFGRLPGDIRYAGRNLELFIPLTSMILLSLLLSLALTFLSWLFF